MINESLGPYKLIELLGSGGMGEVYLAEDSRLHRKVAIKVLPAAFADHPKRLERFEREALAAAALNHPHIAVLFDIGAEDGVHFMVQEYLEGESLRSILDRRKLLLGEALSIAAEVAEALNAAHQAGIVHRDLKPDNIFMTSEGRCKVLDFGLAKLLRDGEGDADASPALDSVAGQIIGTPAYMAPEQANGESADRRADIFAFGSVLYEMVAGKKPFDGSTTSETLYLVAHDQPVAIADLNPTLPFELQRIIEKCQQKAPARRYQTAADLAVDLQELRGDIESGQALTIAAARASATAATSSDTGSWFDRPGWWTVATATALAVTAAWVMISRPSPPEVPVIHFTASLPAEVQITRTERPIVAISRDGQKIVVAADNALYTRHLGDEEFHLVPGSEPTRDNAYAVSPAISPTGEKVVFFVDGSIRCASLDGDAPPITVTDAEMPLSIYWGDDGYVYYSQAEGEDPTSQLFSNDGIWRVPAIGGTPELVVEPIPGRRAVAPQLLPGNNWLMYSTASATDFTAEEQTLEEVVLKNLSTQEVRTIIANGFGGHYVASGHILYQRGTALWAMPFNLEGLESTGGDFRLIDQVPSSYSAGTAYYAVSDNGTLVLPSLSIVTQRNGDISWVEADGSREAIDIPQADNPRVTADGRKIVAEVRGADGTHLWVHEVDIGSWTQLTDERFGEAPVWSNDGQFVYFMTVDEQGPAVWRRSAAIDQPARLLWRPEGHRPFPESTPDSGRFLIYSAGTPDQNDIWLLWLDGDGDRGAVALTETPLVSEEGAQVHPSGRWIAYTSRELGRDDVYVRELSDEGVLGRRFMVSPGGGAEPLWSRDGNILYYRSGPQFLAIDVTAAADFRVSEPRLLLAEFPADRPVLRADYDVTTEGRFLTAIPHAPWNSSLLKVVVAWGKEVGLQN